MILYRFHNALSFTMRFVVCALLTISAMNPVSALESTMQNLWPDTFMSRLEVLKLLQALNAELLSNPSATLTLDRWCEVHHLAPVGSKIVAERVYGKNKPADEAIRILLQVGPDEVVRYRRVLLSCGDKVLSEADNWYVPARLTTDMNEQLNTTNASFGRVVQPLNFSRSTLAAKLLWKPLPDGLEKERECVLPSQAGLVMPAHLLEHRAVLKMPDGTPFSALIETYTSNVLNFLPDGSQN